MTENILLVAFDGLDFDLLTEFETESVRQEEFGRVDVRSGVDKVVTWEIFASLLTGEESSTHGVKKHSDDDHFLLRLSTWLNRYWIFRKWAGIRTQFLKKIGINRTTPTKENRGLTTLFDKLPNSEAFFVPVETKAGWKFSPWDVLNNDRLDDRDFKEVVDKEHLWRKTKFFEAIDEEDPYSFVMVHFHKPDYYQHVFGDEEINYDEEELRELYREMDNLAAEIIEKGEDKYDYIIFMSDHGLPSEDQHNENAFYSVNKKVGLDNPTVFDLHDFILETVGAEDADRNLEEEKEAQESDGNEDRDAEIKRKLEDLGYI